MKKPSLCTRAEELFEKHWGNRGILLETSMVNGSITLKVTVPLCNMTKGNGIVLFIAEQLGLTQESLYTLSYPFRGVVTTYRGVTSYVSDAAELYRPITAW